MNDSASESTSEHELRTLALLGRLAPGLEHRINNLATVLMISAQQISEFSGVPDDQKKHVEQILSETSETLSLIQSLVTRHGSADVADLSALMRAMGSVVAGLNHRVSVAVDPGDSVRVAAGQTELRDLLLLVSLALHDVIPNGGHIRFEVKAGATPSCVAVANSKSGNAVSLVDALGENHSHLNTLLSAANATMNTELSGEQFTLNLSFKAFE